MKKILLSIFSLFAIFLPYTMAQQSVDHATLKSSSIKANEGAPANLAPINRNLSNAALRAGAVNAIPLGSAANVYTILTESQNQVMYNSDINSLVFVHRQNLHYPGPSGVIVFDASTDGGANWETNIGPLSPSISNGTAPTDGARYPSATIYNPGGNTDPNNAFIIATGPALIPAASWGRMWFGSARLDGTDVSDTLMTAPLTPLDGGYFPYGLSMTPQGTAWAITASYDASAPAIDTGALGFRGSFYLLKGTFNTTTKEVDWITAHTLVPDLFHRNTATGLLNFATDYNMAFSPDGNTGYVVIMGSEKGYVDTVPKPIVYKSTDAGNSWNKLPEYDFQADIDPFFPNKRNMDSAVAYFSSFDMTVDAQGRLHMFVYMYGQSTTHPDSLNYIWINGAGSAGLNVVEHLFDVSTSDGTDYRLDHISPFLNVNTTFGSAVDDPRIDAHPQISRTATGSHIFYVWQMTDTLEHATYDNVLPDVYAMGRRIADDSTTVTRNFTFGLSSTVASQAYYPTISPVMITNGLDKKYEMPVVFALPSSGSPLDSVSFYYLKGAGFDEIEFDDKTIGITNTREAKNVINIFPNPTTGILYLESDAAREIKSVVVYDILGNTVEYINSGNITQVDMSTLATGVYFIRMAGKDFTETRKVIVH